MNCLMSYYIVVFAGCRKGTARRAPTEKTNISGQAQGPVPLPTVLLNA